MDKIPTAEEFLKKYNNHDHSKSEGCSCRYRDIVALKEFAKLHVEAYQIELNKRIKTTKDGIMYVDADSILKTYPLENIK